MKTAIDTNALLALLYDDAHADASEHAIRQAYRDSKLVVTPVVYAELAADGHFGTAADLDQFLDDFSIHLESPSRQALFQGGQQFQAYVDRRPDGLQCPDCGTVQTAPCQDCGTPLARRQHVAADFLIGGHAATDADRLISFDRAFFQSYFDLTVLPGDPEAER